jgi:hypothetical protein
MSWLSSEALGTDALGSEVLGSQVLSSEELTSEVLRNDDTSPQLSPLCTLSFFCYVPMRGKKARAGQGRQERRESMLGSDEKRYLAIEALG